MVKDNLSAIEELHEYLRGLVIRDRRLTEKEQVGYDMALSDIHSWIFKYLIKDLKENMK